MKNLKLGFILMQKITDRIQSAIFCMNNLKFWMGESFNKTNIGKKKTKKKNIYVSSTQCNRHLRLSAQYCVQTKLGSSGPRPILANNFRILDEGLIMEFITGWHGRFQIFTCS